MTQKKICCFITGCMLAMLSLSGCSNGGGKSPSPKSIKDMYSDEINTLVVSGTVSKVVVPDSGKPEVSFQITDQNGRGVSGLTTSSPSLLMRFTIATLVPGTAGAPDEWLNYLLRTATGAANGWPTSDSGGKLTDNGDGRYVYTFGKSISSIANVPYVATQTHRIGFTIDGIPTGQTARLTSLPIVYDFVPAGGTPSVVRDIVSVASCNECHTDLGTVLTKSGGTHSRGRGDVRFCVMCHTKQAGALEANTASVNGSFDAGNPIQVADNEILGYFPVLIHKIHMGNKLSKKGYNFWDINFNDIAYPPGNSVLNCTQCHNAAKAPQAGNWQAKPNRTACGACHDGIDWSTGTGHSGGSATNDSGCAGCHTASKISGYHLTNLPATSDATKRSMNAKISGVKIDDTTGQVTATFTVTDNGVAVTDKTKFTTPTFVLAKLVKDETEVLNWVGYTNQWNTKIESIGLQKQTKGENNGTLVANSDGSFSYTFALKTATPEGDIRNVTHAHNVSSKSKGTPGKYATDSVPVNPLYDKTVEIPYPVTYEPTKTHRVAMTFAKVGTPNIDANNAWYDFVPAGGSVTDTRDIVKMKNCANCHANGKLHAAYEIEVCVTCHNPTTKDPGTGETVALENIIHKIHMGSKLQGGPYVINLTHDYSESTFPGIINNCQVCHVESGNINGSNWRTNPTANACITCHDGRVPVEHAIQRVYGCTRCHSPGNDLTDIEKVHSK
ncbi:MAG: OmcA/MtrC family decaheme c-type cytochrome [Desulfuromonadaceae bacterium]|nr:OmcA/MtrC family decaheme c-type cytochrome [Desulfuromonadaceae bacterium]